MKLPISLPDDDVASLHQFLRDHPDVTGLSGAVQAAVRALREKTLIEQYAVAMDEWEPTGQAADWDAVSGDGGSGGPDA